MALHFPPVLLENSPEADLVSFFLFAPPRTFSARELGSRLDIRPNKLLDSLARLVEGGQLKTCSRKGIKYYKLNSTHQFFPEIRDLLLAKGKPYEDELFLEIKRLGAKAAFLSGLFVGRPELPADMLLVGVKANPERLARFIQACEHMMGQEVNYCLMDEAEFHFRQGTFDRFLKDIFDYPYLTVCDLPGPRKKSKTVAA